MPVNFLDWTDDEGPGDDTNADNDGDDDEGPREATSNADENAGDSRAENTGEVGESVLQAGPTACGGNSGESLREGENSHITDAGTDSKNGEPGKVGLLS